MILREYVNIARPFYLINIFFKCLFQYIQYSVQHSVQHNVQYSVQYSVRYNVCLYRVSRHSKGYN